MLGIFWKKKPRPPSLPNIRDLIDTTIRARPDLPREEIIREAQLIAEKYGIDAQLPLKDKV